MPFNRINVLNFQKFSKLVANVFIEQFLGFTSFLPMCTFPVKTILELSRIIVRDSSGVMQCDPVNPRQLLPLSTPPPAIIFTFSADWLQLLASKFFPAPPVASQPSANAAETANFTPPGGKKYVAAPFDILVSLVVRQLRLRHLALHPRHL